MRGAKGTRKVCDQVSEDNETFAQAEQLQLVFGDFVGALLGADQPPRLVEDDHGNDQGAASPHRLLLIVPHLPNGAGHRQATVHPVHVSCA